MESGKPSPDQIWAQSRAGSHAGRGFHYQDAVAAELAILAWAGKLPIKKLTPEGLEDVSIELADRAVHLQAKSRREHRGEFTAAELTDAWRHLATRLLADPSSHIGLVPERPISGATATGFDRTLADVANHELRRSIAAAVRAEIAPELFISRAHLIVMPASALTSIELLASKLTTSPAACAAHHAIVLSHVADLADQNGIRQIDDAAAVTLADIASIIERVSEAIDPSALDEAVRCGIAELVDFRIAIHDPRFYTGVDVVAGHVVAGLTLERRELVQKLEAGLSQQRIALAVGPSGAGKSALLWLTAYSTRSDIRWYRIRRLDVADVKALVRLVRGFASTEAMLGFIVDDLGRDDRLGFDHLVDELRHHPRVCVLGACREEDLFPLQSAHSAAQIRPLLDEELAKRVWHELRGRRVATEAGWREAFEASKGLLLEYGHLVSEGTRLEETIAGQVDRRIREGRGTELDILALVATAHSFGGEIAVRDIAERLPADNAALRVALARLLEEHLLTERGGSLRGLHELRSRYLMRATHRVPPPVLEDTVRDVIDFAGAAGLQPLLVRILRERTVSDDVAIDAIAQRVARDHEPVALAASLHALRLATLERMADRWRMVFAAERVPVSAAGAVALLFKTRTESSGLVREPIRRAVQRMRAIESPDLRRDLIELAGDSTSLALTDATSIGVAATVLAALGEVGSEVAIDPDQLARLADQAPLPDVRLLLESAYAAAPRLAADVARALGGSDTLLRRLATERPWVRNAGVGVDDDGHEFARADYVYVTDSHQPDPHAEVVDIARYLAALVPTADEIICTALDATGRTAGYKNVPIADKRIPRENLASPVQVAWNRAMTRAVIASVAGKTETEHLHYASSVVSLSAQLTRRVGNAYARGEALNNRIRSDAKKLAAASDQVLPSPVAVEGAGPLDEGDLAINDPVAYIGTTIANNVVPRLFAGEHPAPLIRTLSKRAADIARPEYWRLLSRPPVTDAAALRDTLDDLWALTAEKANGNPGSVPELTRAGRLGLRAAARKARELAEARMQALSQSIENALAAAGFEVRVVRGPGLEDSDLWPSNEFLVLIESTSVLAWSQDLEKVADLARPFLESRAGFWMAPMRGGQLVSELGVRVLTDIFPNESMRDWPSLPVPVLDAPFTSHCRRSLGGLVQMSGILSCMTERELHAEELAALQSAERQFDDGFAFIREASIAAEHPLLDDVAGALSELVEQVRSEAASPHEPTSNVNVARAVLAGISGEINPLFAAYVGLILVCVELDVDPEHASHVFPPGHEPE